MVPWTYAILLLACAVALSDAQPPLVSGAVFVRSYSQALSGNTYWKYTGQGGTSSVPYFISQLNFDSISSSIVVGAADWLYVLNQNLTLVAQLSLPPRASTAACSAAVGYNPDYVCRNHLRVFSSSPSDPAKLLVCGSDAAGTPSCRVINISNLMNFNSVTATNGLLTVRPDLYGSGIGYNINNPRNNNFFSVSTLNLNATNTGLFFFTVSYTNSSDPNTLSTVLQLRTNSVANFRAPVFVDTYMANYAPRTAILPGVMDTISPDEHKYFFVFLRDSLSNGTTISQVVRVCQNDPGNSTDNAPLTLVKARINCISARSSTNYNAISGAAFNQMGRYYQNGDWAQFMYGVFTTSISGVSVSAVCVYPANNSVDDTTDANGRNGGVFDIFRTLLMNPNTGTPTTSGYVECTSNGNMARPDYTYTDTILPITQIGSEPLAAITGVTVTKIALDQTCVASNNASLQTCVIQDVLFLGTAAGTVMKVVMGYLSGTAFPIISEEIKLDDSNGVRQMSIQQQGGAKYLYVNTDTSIYRIPVQRCNRYLSCSTCVGSRDPYCVWNTSLSQCVVSSIVPTNYNGSASLPNGIYQNIHTGIFNSCPALTLTVSSSTSSILPAFVGSSFNVLCTPNDGRNGATVSSYRWYRNGAALTDGGRVTGATLSTLTVTSVTLMDQGVFQCTATNIEGTNSSLSNGIQLSVIDVMVTSQPQSLSNVLPGRMANFSVTAAGAGSFTYQWQYGNGTSIPSGGRYQGVAMPTLVISPVVGGDNNSVYMCRVTSPSGNTTTTQPVSLTLASAPVITQQPIPSISVVFGQNVSLSCSANGLGPLTVHWITPPGITPPQQRQYSGYDVTDTLVFPSVNTTHRGTYTCVVTDSRGIMVSSISSSLAVIVPPTNAAVQKGTVPGIFTCIADDGVGGATITSYQWLKDGTVLSNGGRVTGANLPTLSISNVMPQDQGLYQCNVTNVDGVSSLSTGATLVFADPVIVTQPSSQVVLPDSTASFSIGAVSVVGGGSVSYMWTYSNGSQLWGNRFQGTNTSVLTINPVMVADSGSSFVCIVTGASGNTEISQLVTLTLAMTPVFTMSPSDTTAVFGDNATLTCTAVGVGTLVLIWQTTSSHPLTQPMTITLPSSPSTFVSRLFLNNLSTAHRGLYWCQANDSTQTIAVSNQAVLSISVPIPQAISVAAAILGNFACRAEDGVGGATITSYQWYRNSVALSNGGRVTGANLPTLSISNVMSQDQGLYQCNVTNVDGVSSLSEGVLLLTTTNTAPVFTTSPTSTTGTTNSTITFTCTALGLGNISIMWNTTASQSISQPATVLSPPYTATSTLTLGPLSVEHQGQYWCTAVDSSARVGMSDLASLNINNSPPLNLETSCSWYNGTSFALKCSVNHDYSGNTISGYQWYGNGQLMGMTSNSLNTFIVPDEGTYRCAVNTDGITLSSKDVHLTANVAACAAPTSSGVNTQPQVLLPSDTTYGVFGGLAGLCAILLLLVIVMCCCCVKQRKPVYNAMKENIYVTNPTAIEMEENDGPAVKPAWTTNAEVGVASSNVDTSSSKVDTSSSKVDTSSSKVDTSSSKVDMVSLEVDMASSKAEEVSAQGDSSLPGNVPSPNRTVAETAPSVLNTRDNERKLESSTENDVTTKL